MSSTQSELLKAIREARAKVIEAKKAVLEFSHCIDQPHLYVIAKSELARAGSDLKLALIDLQKCRHKAELVAEHERSGDKRLGELTRTRKAEVRIHLPRAAFVQ